jgi:hypothetical protein
MQLWKAEMFLCYGLSFPLNRSREEKPSWAPTCSLVVYSLRSVFVVVPDNKFVLLVFVRSERHQIRNGGSNGLLNSTGIAKNRALFSDGTSRVLQSADQHKSVRHNQDTVTRARCANSEAGVKWAEGQRMGGVAGVWLAAGLFIGGLRKPAAVNFHELLSIEFQTLCSWIKLWRMVLFGQLPRATVHLVAFE